MSKENLLGEFSETMSAEQQLLRNEAFHLLLRGQPVSLEELARATALPVPRVRESSTELASRGLIRIDRQSQEIVASWGVSVVPTAFRMTLGGKPFYGWCAEDVLGIPAALRANSLTEGSCIECGRSIRVKLEAGEVVEAEPKSAHVWIGEADLGSLMEAT